MKNTAADWGLIGVLSSVCTVLLGTAGVALRQVANHNTTLIARVEKRDADILRLNKLLIKQAFELGQLREGAQEKARDLNDALAAKNKLEAENRNLVVQRETAALEMLGLRHVNENLVKQISALEAAMKKLKGQHHENDS